MTRTPVPAEVPLEDLAVLEARRAALSLEAANGAPGAAGYAHLLRRT